MDVVEIAGIPIGDGHPCPVVAELGSNHAGSLKTALKMIHAAKDAGADFVKLQCRTPHLSVPESEWHELRDTPWGKMEKLKYRERVELDILGYQRIAEECEGFGIPWFVSVWDIPSLEFIQETGLPIHALKIPSARLRDLDLIRAASLIGSPVILSTGMSTMDDVRVAVKKAQKHFDANSKEEWLFLPQLILLQCSSSYPARADESDLRVIHTYKHELGYPVGFSSHKIGIDTCIGAVYAGANLVERHFSLDRSAKGSDHRMSSTPDDIRRLVKEIRRVETILGSATKRIFDSEKPEMKRLGK